MKQPWRYSMYKITIALLFTLAIVAPVYALEKASEARLNEVAEKGVHVMPFNLEKTVHVFSKTKNGGVQQVNVKDASDLEQLKLIREHLVEITNDFKQGDFYKPAKIHGDSMPGLEALRNAQTGQVNIVYKETPDGAEITYATEVPELITAIHQWFDAQLSDHARHAVSGHGHGHDHQHHQMHDK